jgi:threonine aldolase
MSPLATIIKADKPFIYDLTSDTATIPTDEMFDIMKTATRGDDVYQVKCRKEMTS